MSYSFSLWLVFTPHVTNVVVEPKALGLSYVLIIVAGLYLADTSCEQSLTTDL